MLRSCFARWVALALAGSPLVAAQAQQVCDAALAPSAPASRFSGDADGHITDSATQLMWMRCPLGQTWRTGQCTGPAVQLDWPASAAAAARINATGELFYNDWRLPSVRELATVTERRCSQPRINLAVFPGTPAAGFWTGTPSLKSTLQAYSMDFAAGGVVAVSHGTPLHVRLVRNAP